MTERREQLNSIHNSRSFPTPAFFAPTEGILLDQAEMLRKQRHEEIEKMRR